MSVRSCIGCGAEVPDVDGPTHLYIGASPGCWAVYMEVMSREFGKLWNPATHRLSVDTYAVQHPGTPSRRAIQSVGGHLVRMHLVLERGLDADRATRGLVRAVERSAAFIWLEPPPSLGAITVLDVVEAASPAEHRRVVRAWAESVWEAWSAHHGTVRSWALLP